ncbi:TPR repeat-containing protein [Chloroherpeton thalassium ATCC 35110]|uniref:TPR repeat-containing protein n=1 Tax=Chloroherpeton thalassium (strain ATCC 35110 / GB-78) TaxID=517418 RepID=B3QYK5_CHLT3|nr:tetratricopeptide repeat protein [Chloroherpeton thalassium]ACF13633.1 TPR repeat-containing protein [Chloroherpeton thalassium ATCC 35110]
MKIYLPSELQCYTPVSTTLDEQYISNPIFIGRDQEIATLSRDLLVQTAQLITITGAGGIGKTRLVLEIAFRLRDHFPDGVFFVPLASVDSPESLLNAITNELRFSLHSRLDLKTRLNTYLKGKNILLVLDNYEHLLDGAYQEQPRDCRTILIELLAASPGTKLLVTSREPLGMPIERIYELKGMPYPNDEMELNPESFSSVELFLSEAERVKPGTIFSPAEKRYIARMCKFVEGMPLGVKLAASWVRTLTCKEISQEFEELANVQAVPSMAVPERHRNMRYVFEQSWRRLTDEEQSIIKRCAVFRGGAGKKAIDSIAGANLPILSSLIEKSLIHRTISEGYDQHSRYDVHELLRQFSEEKLMARPEEANWVRLQHCQYFLNLLSELDASLTAGNQIHAISEIEEDIDNIRVAWLWAVKNDLYTEMSSAVGPLAHFFDIRGLIYEGCELFEIAIKKFMAGGLSPKSDSVVEKERLTVLGMLLLRQGFLFSRLSRYNKAVELLEQSLLIFRSLNNVDKELAFALNYLGHVEYFIGKYEAADVHCNEALAIREKMDDKVRIGDTMINIGFGAFMKGDFKKAEDISKKIASTAKEKNDRRGQAIGTGALAYVNHALGLYDIAQIQYEESISICNELGLQWFSPWFMTNFSLVELALGNEKKAMQLATESIALIREIGDQYRLIHARVNLATILIETGSLDEANRSAIQALEMSQDVSHCYGEARALNILAAIAIAKKQPQIAFNYALKSERINEVSGQRAVLGQAHGLLGKAFLQTRDLKKALSFIGKGFKESTYVNAIPQALEMLTDWAAIYLMDGKEKDGLEFLNIVNAHAKTPFFVKARATGLLTQYHLMDAIQPPDAASLHDSEQMFRDLANRLLRLS